MVAQLAFGLKTITPLGTFAENALDVMVEPQKVIVAPLHAKKYSEALDVWQDRVTQGWRFYFKIEGDEYVILFFYEHG